jgi:hypothetical protein
MFLRFRQSKTTLIVQLVEAHRVNGTAPQRHRASLGSVSAEAPRPLDRAWTRAWPWEIVKDRAAIWQALNEAIADLAIDGATATKLMTALQARVSYVTEEDLGRATGSRTRQRFLGRPEWGHQKAYRRAQGRDRHA